MSRRNTRNKIKHQLKSAEDDLKKAQTHMGLIGALSDDRSDYIDTHLPNIVLALEMLLSAIDEFNEGI